MIKNTTKKLEKLVRDSQKTFARPYAFVSEHKPGTIGNWLTNGHFAFRASEGSELFKLATIDKSMFDGQQCLIGMDELGGYAPAEEFKTLKEVHAKYKYERILECSDGCKVLVNNIYFEAIREGFPNATVYIKSAEEKILWIDEETKEIVALCMPLRGDK